MDYRGDVLAHASGDRRIITSAFVVGLIVCSALIATRNRADDHPQRSGASVPNRTILTEEVALGVYRMPSAQVPVQIRRVAPDMPTIMPVQHEIQSPVTTRDEPRASDSVEAIAAVPTVQSTPSLTLAAQVDAAPPLSRDQVALPPAGDRLDVDDVYESINNFVRRLRSRTSTSSDLTEFFAHGSAHQVALADEPSTASASDASVRVTFDVSLLRNDAFGRNHERVLPVTMIIAKRDGEVRASAVALGELRSR